MGMEKNKIGDLERGDRMWIEAFFLISGSNWFEWSIIKLERIQGKKIGFLEAQQRSELLDCDTVSKAHRKDL